MANLPPVQMVKVQSSYLAEVGYRVEDATKQTGTLFVRFHPKKGQPEGSGALWGYSGVPAQRHLELIGADSPGKYFIAQIRDLYKEGGGYLYPRCAWEG